MPASRRILEEVVGWGIVYLCYTVISTNGIQAISLFWEQLMEIEFTTTPDFDFVTSFGEQINAPVHGNTLMIPPSLGTGYVRKMTLASDFKVILHRYRLHEELVIKRLPAVEPVDLINFIFHTNDEPASMSTRDSQVPLAENTEFAVQISSPDLCSTVRFPAEMNIDFTVVGISATRLKSLLTTKNSTRLVGTILIDTPGFLFYERLDAPMQRLLRQLTESRDDGKLSPFYYSIKVQELIYVVMEKLLSRESRGHMPLVRDDMDKLFMVRTNILADLSRPPHLHDLTRLAGLSETKMKGLFRQVFGNSIYAYYQQARMEEAAFLLKHGGYSVAEVGSQVGFQNLSHFSRLFEKHFGVRPKQYSSGG